MITAIPMNEDRIANHFSKAEKFLFINEHGEEVSRHANPVYLAQSAGKKALLHMLIQQGADRVIVRNIGQRMLGKLLDHRLGVFQIERGRRDISELAKPEATGVITLTEAEQGRPSLNYDANKKEGGRQHHREAGLKQGRCGHHRSHGHAAQEEHRECCGHNGRGHGRGDGHGYAAQEERHQRCGHSGRGYGRGQGHEHGHGRCGEAKPRGRHCCGKAPF